MATEKRGFARVSPETIQLCADRLGVQASEEVFSGLGEDVSFRIRQIADVACQFMHHSKRRRLTVDDMDKAMKYSGLEPLHGYHSAVSHHYGNILLDQVTLTSHANDHISPNHTPSVTATWQAVEGVKVGEKEVLEESVQLPQASSEAQVSYLSLLLEAVTGEDEDKRRVALSAVQNKGSVASVLPDLIQYIQETLVKWDQFKPAQLLKILKLVLALLSNGGVYLEPYYAALYPLLRAILLSQSYLSSDEEVEHWHVRQITAAALAQLLKRSSNDYCQELFPYFQELFGHPQDSLVPVFYGALLVLCHLGPASIAEVFLRHMKGVLHHLSTIVELSTKHNAKKLDEVILVAAEQLLTSEVGYSPPVAAPRSSSLTDRVSRQSQTSSSSENGGITGRVPGEGALFGAAGSLSLGPVSSVLEGEMMTPELSRPTPPAADTPPSSLYNYLEDMLGEGLTFRLLTATRERVTSPPPPPARPQTTEAPSPEVEPPNKDISASRVKSSLESLLSREGFRPVHHHCSQHGVRRGGLSLTAPALPVPFNVLDKDDGGHSARGRPPSSVPVQRHMCAGLTGRRRPRQPRQLSSIAVGNVWI